MPIPIPQFHSRNKTPKRIDPKPIHIRIDLPDGQFHEWDMAPGDAVGYGPLRVDTLTPTLIRKRHRVHISFVKETAAATPQELADGFDVDDGFEI